jgi:hypothetical protein
MSGRSVTGLPFYVFAPLCGIWFAAACSSDATNYFDTPNPAAGKSAAGTGGSVAATGGTDAENGGTGGSTAGTGAEVGGSGGDAPSRGGSGGSDSMGGSSNPSGGMPHVGGAGGTAPNQGGTGQGGTTTDGGMSGDNGAGETATGGTGAAGTGGTQTAGGEGGTQGGMAGDPGVGGTGGTAGAGNGGTAGAGTGGTGGQPGVCSADDDCDPSQYCKKTSCDAATGTCTERAASCTGSNATLDPVCGCDHMTYYTACVAAHQGINVASNGACGNGAATCNRTEGGSSCSPTRARAACYRTRSTTSCSTGAAPNDGVCWVLPEACPPEATTELDCNNGAPTCRGLCDALEKNRPVIRDSKQCD